MIAAMAVVAALIATLSYTSVVDPPLQRSDCQTLCPETIATLVWLNLYATLQQEASGSFPISELVQFLGNINIPVNASLGVVVSFWVVFNGLALYLALMTIFIATFGILFKLQSGANSREISAKVLVVSAYPLLFSLFSALAAFTFAQFITFYIVGGRNVAAWITLVAAVLSLPCVAGLLALVK